MKFLASLLTLNSLVAPLATDLEVTPRLLQVPVKPSSGRFCRVSVSVECKLTGTNDDCTSINPQPFGTCGPRFMTMKYKFCNLLNDKNIVPLRVNPSGESGTVAMYRQQSGTPQLLLGIMAPNTCREAEVTEEINSCKKRIVGDLKFEGW